MVLLNDYLLLLHQTEHAIQVILGFDYDVTSTDVQNARYSPRQYMGDVNPTKKVNYLSCFFSSF